MSAAAQIDNTGATNTTLTVAGTILTYAGPNGAFPAASICYLQVTVVAYDATGGGKSFYVNDVAVFNIGGTLTLLTASNPTPRATASTGTTQAIAPTFAISGSNLVVTGARAQSGNSVQWSARVDLCDAFTP